MSHGKVSKRTWLHDGQKREAWSFVVRVDGRRIRKSGYLSRAEAQAALDAVKHPAPAPVAVAPPSTLTLGPALERYYQAKARKKSIANDRRMGRALLAVFGDIPLAAVTASKISEYKAARLAVERSRRGKALSPASINRPLAMLRHLLRVAHEEWEAVPSVPKIKLEREPQGRIRWLEPDEEARLLAACGRSQSPALLPVVVMALETGLRKGEILGLNWDRVDLSRGVLRLETTKSGKRREVPMRQRVYDTLAGLTGSRVGRVWPVGDLRTSIENAVAAAKLDGPFRFHDCRHHFASWFMMRGGSLLALKEIGGWASLKMVERYAHLSPDHLREEIAKTEGARPQGTAEMSTTVSELAEGLRKSS